MYLPSKKYKKPKRIFLKPSRYQEIANIDLDQLRVQRYVMPIPVDVEGGAGRGKLDKKKA